GVDGDGAAVHDGERGVGPDGDGAAGDGGVVEIDVRLGVLGQDRAGAGVGDGGVLDHQPAAGGRLDGAGIGDRVARRVNQHAVRRVVGVDHALVDERHQ